MTKSESERGSALEEDGNPGMSRVWLQVCERMREHVCVCACRDDVKCMRERSVNYLQDAAGSRNLVLDLSIAHDHYGSSTHPRHNGLLTHAQDLDAPLRVAARTKMNN